jgi:hypothetical protein
VPIVRCIARLLLRQGWVPEAMALGAVGLQACPDVLSVWLVWLAVLGPWRICVRHARAPVVLCCHMCMQPRTCVTVTQVIQETGLLDRCRVRNRLAVVALACPAQGHCWRAQLKPHAEARLKWP